VKELMNEHTNRRSVLYGGYFALKLTPRSATKYRAYIKKLPANGCCELVWNLPCVSSMRESITDMSILNTNGNTIAKLGIHVVIITSIGKEYIWFSDRRSDTWPENKYF